MAARALCACLALGLLAPCRAAALSDEEKVELAEIDRDLKTGLWNARIHAVHRLEPLDAAGLPSLELAARDPDWQVRLTAVHYLGRLGLAGRDSLAAVLKEEPCRHVRITAIHWLGSMGPEAAPALEEALSDESAAARLTDRYWLRKLGSRGLDPIGDSGDAYASKSEDLRLCASSFKPGRLPAPLRKEALPPTAAAQAPEARPAEPSAAVLAPAPAPDEARLPLSSDRARELDLLLAEEELPPAQAAAPRRTAASAAAALAQASHGRGEPALALGKSPSAAEAMPEGGAGSSARIPAPGTAAVVKDRGLAKPEHDPLPGLLQALRSPDAQERARAADELGKRGEQAAPAVTALVQNLKHPDRRVRASSALALGNIGRPADSSVRALVLALQDRSEDVAWSAAVALGRLGTPRARRAFQRYLRDQAKSLDRSKGAK